MRALCAVAAAATLIAATGCGDVLGYDSDFEGFYSYAGTVDGLSSHSVVGNVTITRQRGNRARVAIDWEYLDRSQTVVHITTDAAADAFLDDNGRIYFDFEGDLFVDGRTVFFTLSHDGWLQGRTITGDWRLVTELPTDDSGSFTARR
jgi:hypothetical protein